MRSCLKDQKCCQQAIKKGQAVLEMLQEELSEKAESEVGEDHEEDKNRKGISDICSQKESAHLEKFFKGACLVRRWPRLGLMFSFPWAFKPSETVW